MYVTVYKHKKAPTEDSKKRMRYYDIPRRKSLLAEVYEIPKHDFIEISLETKGFLASVRDFCTVIYPSCVIHFLYKAPTM